MGVITLIAFVVKVICDKAAKGYETDKENPPETKNGHYLTNYGMAVRSSEIAKWVSRGFAGITVIFLLISVLTIVPTKKVGVVTTFGKPTGTLSNGLHLIAPWDKVTEFDAAIQTDKHDDQRAEADVSNDQSKCTRVRIGNQSTACVSNSIR